MTSTQTTKVQRLFNHTPLCISINAHMHVEIQQNHKVPYRSQNSRVSRKADNSKQLFAAVAPIPAVWMVSPHCCFELCPAGPHSTQPSGGFLVLFSGLAPEGQGFLWSSHFFCISFLTAQTLSYNRHLKTRCGDNGGVNGTLKWHKGSSKHVRQHKSNRK